MFQKVIQRLSSDVLNLTGGWISSSCEFLENTATGLCTKICSTVDTKVIWLVSFISCASKQWVDDGCHAGTAAPGYAGCNGAVFCITTAQAI